MKKCINFFIAFLCCLFFSCDMEIEEILRQKRLEYISVDTTEAVKLEYLIGDKFNSEGIKIYGHYSDETQVEEDLRLVSFSGFDSSQAAEKNTITVLFNEKETTFDVKIHESKIEKIQIIQKPIKQFFRVGESNDTTGIIVKATYTNGNETPLAEDEYILEGFDSSKAGMCLVNVILKEDTKIYDAYTVVFQDYDIKEIKISKNPNKLIYMVGEELDLTGLEVYATPENGLPPFLLPQYNYSPASIKDITATGKQTITINVNEVKASFDIEIVDAYVKGFVVKDKDGNPEGGIIEDSKRIYCAGDTFKLEHFEFYELYSNDAIGQEITSDNGKMEKLSFVFDGEEHGYEDECVFEEAGVHTISIKYEFEDITTKENTSSTIEIKVCVTDSEIDGIEATWSSDRASGYPKWITPDNSKPEYGNWTVKAILKNGEEVSIGAEYCTYEYVDRAITENSETNVKVTYYDIRTKKEYIDIKKVKVIKPILQKVEIDKLPKTEYVVGDMVYLGGLVVKGTYSDGHDENIETDGIEEYEPTVIADDNQRQIVVTYQDNVECTIPIKIYEDYVTGISVQADIPDNFSFRKGKLYDSNFFKDYFSVYRVKKFGGKESYKIESHKLNYTIKEGSIIIVYNLNEKKYSTVYNNNNIRILPALPTSVEILPSDGELYDGLEGIIKSPNTELKVSYSDAFLSKKEKDAPFTDIVGTYILEKKGDGIEVKFTPKEYAVGEAKNFEKNFENVLSKNKIIVESGITQQYSYKTETEDVSFSDLKVYMEYSNGKKQEICFEDIQKNPKFEILWGDKYDYKMPDMSGKILVTYTDTTDQENPETYYCTYDNVEYSPPKPKTVSLRPKENIPDSTIDEAIEIGSCNDILNYLSWTVKYEDGSELSKEDSNDYRWQPTFTIKENENENKIELVEDEWDLQFSKKIEEEDDDIYKIEVDREILFFKLEKKPPEVPGGDGGGVTP